MDPTPAHRADPLPHPWNGDFAWRDHRASASVLDQAAVDAFDQAGYVVVPGLLDPDELAAVLAETDRFEAETDALLADQPGGRLAIAETGAITFSPHLVGRSAVLRRLAAHPRILGLCADLIGPDVRLYWDQAVYKKPEKPRPFPWHQDNGYTFVEPQDYLTVWLALTDATEDNGCPEVATGLHRRGTLAHHYVDPLGFVCLEEWDDPAVAPVRAGGAVVFSSLTPHRTGPNRTDSVRKAYILQYAPEGARALRGDPAGMPTGREVCDDPVRQFLVLRHGRPAANDPPDPKGVTSGP